MMWSLTLPDPLRSTGPYGVRLKIPHIGSGFWITSKWLCWPEPHSYVVMVALPASPSGAN